MVFDKIGVESARDDIAALAYQGAEAGAVAVVKMGGDIPDCRVMLGAAQQHAGQQRIDRRQLLRQRLEKIDAEAAVLNFSAWIARRYTPGRSSILSMGHFLLSLSKSAIFSIIHQPGEKKKGQFKRMPCYFPSCPVK
ncbi:MAG: hypothetical protein V8S89_06655 [Oscillospiraceae bacterium]